MDVICLGILVADIFANPMPALPAPGQLGLTDRFLLGAGGCASNTAACLSRLGRKVKVLGKVGTDLFGGFVLDDLRRLGVDCSSVAFSKTHPTSGTVIVNVTGEDRRYIHCVGANADFSFADIDCSVLDGARVLYVGGYMVMPKFGAEDLTQLFRAAKQRSVKTALDVVTPPGLAMSRNQLESMLAYTDAFLPNDDEAEAMTGLKDPVAQGSFLSDLNPACDVVITLGARGAVAIRNREIIRAGPYTVQSVDESGAGDAFAAGFITGLLEDWSLEKTLSFASAVGASCTSALGCTAGVFTFDEALAFGARQPLKIERIRND
ncbi:MAG: carbohydrate kinase family protein [Acidobacteria bacterium]|nr:carbohydrate kinase family protein [Acidobacteriota bacterium]